MTLWLINPASAVEPLPGTKLLTEDGDLAAKMVAGIHTYLDRETAASVENRKQFWKPDFSSIENYAKSVAPNRERLRKYLGVVDKRLPPNLEYVGGPDQPALVAETERYKVFAVRWAVLPGVDGEGLLLEPKDKAVANVIAIPDTDQTPEQLVGLAPGIAPRAQFARRLAESGCRVVSPVLIDRRDEHSANPRLGRATNIPHREFVHRMAFEMGRTLLGYEVQKVLAVIDWFERGDRTPQVGVCGYGEGGRVALHAAALDVRIAATVSSGYFHPSDAPETEPIDRNTWAGLREFDDADVARLVAPRVLLVERSPGPKWPGPQPARPGRGGAAPGRLPTLDTAPLDEAERTTARLFDRAYATYAIDPERETRSAFMPCVTESGFGEPHTLSSFRAYLTTGVKLVPGSKIDVEFPNGKPPTDARKNFDPAVRHKRQFDQLVAFTQKLWRDGDATRKEFWKKADASSPEAWEKSCDWYRDYFHTEVIGKLPEPTVPLNPRSRQVYDEPKFTGYEVMLDVYPDLFAQGILLLPKDLKPGEKRPVVVCQHGLEGTPRHTIDPEPKRVVYNQFARRLVELGYIVYAPQNPYYGKDAFRQLQRKANPLKLSLFSFIIRQHQRTLDWLETLPNVDPKRIAFYGLSYGGKTAMRVPAVEKRYCLSICSGDFNEWVGKMVSVDLDRSYMWTGEYEMYEFDLGNTFNYAEMAYLIAPRPFMVERGHDDGVGTDEMVAYEYAKVRYLYQNRLKLGDRTAVEFFPGGHEIRAKGTFDFLKTHLAYPK